MVRQPVSYTHLANRTDFTSDEVDYNQEGILNSYISYRNKSGKSGKQGFCNGEFTSIDGTITGTGEGIVDSYYCVVSYMSYESMDLKCTIVNQDVKPNTGIYVPEQKMRELGLTKEDILGLELTMDVAVPVKRIVDEDKGQYVTDWCVSKQLTFPVRGILQEDAYFYSDAIYAPSEILMQCVEDNRTEKDILDDYQKKFGQNLSDSMTYNWRPWAYYLMVDDVSNIDSVKKAVAEISPDLNVIHEYQDYEAIMESVDNTQRIVLYISLAILAILLCLSAIVYVNIIDKRKYEFAMLRANGLTKGEIRKLVMTEMAVQAFWTFAVSLLFAWVIFLVLSNTIGGFQFDWMTVMWLAVISVVSVILPSVVTLVLTNKYEPDAIMRN